jgi:hypothetical protein
VVPSSQEIRLLYLVGFLLIMSVNYPSCDFGLLPSYRVFTGEPQQAKCEMKTIALLASLLFLQGFPTPQNKPSQQTFELCGVKLRPQVTALANDIAKKRKHAVICELDSLKNINGSDYGGVADFDGNVPRIKIDKSQGDDLETTIAHELFHHELWASGQWSMRSEVPLPHCGKPIGVDQARISLFTEISVDHMQHRIFYPKMRAMKLNPNNDLDASFDRVPLMERHWDAYKLAPEIMAIVYARAEEFNSERRDQIVASLQEKGLGRQIELGKSLLKLIEKSNPQNNDEAVRTAHEMLIMTYCDPSNTAPIK